MNKIPLFLAIMCVAALLISGCGPTPEQNVSPQADCNGDVGDETWHKRYVADSCARCPECCVEVTENGFIDAYGVERPADWLPGPEEDDNE